MICHLAPDGDDRWSGRPESPNADRTDGPWATLPGALAALRRLRGSGALDGAVTVYVRGGRYELDAPVVVTPADSWPLTFQAFPGEQPVFSGGRRIVGWTTTVVAGQTAWVVDLPEVRDGTWEFRSLFVNGRRATRPRWPRQGLFRMAEVPGLQLPAAWGQGGQTAFVSRPEDPIPRLNLTDVEVVYLHFWIEERSPIRAYDPVTRRVTMARTSRAPLVGTYGSQLADYYLDNVGDALGEPGEWYLDRAGGRLTYLPLPGETPATTDVVAPRCLQLLVLRGEPDREAWVEHLRFEGIGFAHTDWRHPSGDGATIFGSSGASAAGRYSRRHRRGRDAAAAQAACDVPGVITLEGTRHCTIANAVIEHLGWYGIEIGDACENVRVRGCTLRDLGAGGVTINGAAHGEPDAARRHTHDHAITDNTIARVGRVFHSAVGVLSMHASRVTIAHNHIHDLFYTAISVGWEWGYAAHCAHDNLIVGNHLHDIGQGLLSDMGGIYTLGVQPGTVIRGNLIHGVRSAHYGGWCIYPDEGSSHLLIEGNLCYDADRQAFHQHYGRENLVINNIFAFGGKSVAHYTRPERHVGCTFLRNLFVSAGQPMFSFGTSAPTTARHRSDLNLYCDVTGAPPRMLDRARQSIDWEAWRALGHDGHAVCADPRFRDVARRDFALADGSPALALGFVPLDLSTVGPRPPQSRGDLRGLVEPPLAGAAPAMQG